MPLGHPFLFAGSPAVNSGLLANVPTRILSAQSARVPGQPFDDHSLHGRSPAEHSLGACSGERMRRRAVYVLCDSLATGLSQAGPVALRTAL
ncbi:hypothetical protein GQ53DRAFT_742158 [Thozetella sp. PMI_491]|nr:hypothetical protein GQ53DRAFT_742158 [Thozetella sp. PMI_491]